MAIVTCRTEGCENADVGIDVGDLTSVNPDTGETETVDSVVCGPCGQPITDIDAGAATAAPSTQQEGTP